ncbi:unnamed protein product [Symbiodinium sp. CCMP2592]|nr:unnamed protein product [Symbiodinium sp. CCMP2592]
MTGKLLQKHPNFPKEMTLLKSFDTIKDISQKTFENSAEFQMEAENVDEEDMHDAMEALMDQEMPQAPTDGNVPPPNPKPREPKKAKKEKTWRDKAQDADKRANKEIIEYEGFKQASHMKAAIMADVDPAKCDLEKVKTKVAIAIGQKLPEDSMKPLFHELEDALKKFRTASEPVRAAERKSNAAAKPPKAKPKAKAKAGAK